MEQEFGCHAEALETTARLHSIFDKNKSPLLNKKKKKRLDSWPSPDGAKRSREGVENRGFQHWLIACNAPPPPNTHWSQRDQGNVHFPNGLWRRVAAKKTFLSRVGVGCPRSAQLSHLAEAWGTQEALTVLIANSLTLSETSVR